LDGILAYIGIGSNVGEPLPQCKAAVQKISCINGVKLERVSSYYKTEPVIDSIENIQKLKGQNWFINAVAEVRTTLNAHELLKAMQSIENDMGRKREFKGAPRTIDLDLLLYGQEIVAEDDLIIPHPQTHKRRFVLDPMCEIASYVIHPVYGVSMRGLKERLDDQKAVERLTICEEMQL